MQTLPESEPDAKILHFKCLAMNGAHNYDKNIKMYVLWCTTIGLKQKCGHKTSRRADMDLRFKPTSKIGQFFRTYVAEDEIVCWCYLTPFMFIYVVLPID